MSLSKSLRIWHRVTETPRRRNSFLKLGFEPLEQRYCLAAEISESLSAVPTSMISEQQAIALALNHLAATEEGYVLENRRHTATFTSDGLLMEPKDGGPQWQWQLSHVGSSTDHLAEVPVDSVVPNSDGKTLVTYDRGLLIEQYVAHGDSIEQQFVIPAPLPLDGGDLIVAGTIQSAGEFEATDAGWLWRTDTGVISLGDVTVFDATGSEIAASMHVTTSDTRIVIAADVLAEAMYPLLIDPQVGTNDFRISDMGPGAADFDANSAAVAYNSTNNEYLVVWSGDNFVNDKFEIFGQRINAATGAEVGNDDFRISHNAAVGNDGDFDAFDPGVAYNKLKNEYLVVWSDDRNVEDAFEIFGQRMNAFNGSTTGGRIEISNTIFSGDAQKPAVASIGGEYFVVWQEDRNEAPLVDNEFEIYGRRIGDPTGEAVTEGILRISDVGVDGSADRDALNPAVAVETIDGDYLVVWQGDDSFDNEFEIFGQRLRHFTATTFGEFGTNDLRISGMGPIRNPDFDATNPAVAYNSTNFEFLVVWQGDDNTGLLVDNEFEIYGQRIFGSGFSGNEVGEDDFRISDMGPDGNAEFRALDPAVAYNPTTNQYLVTWNGDDNTAPLVQFEFEIFGQRLNGADATQVGANDFRISDMGPDGSSPFAAASSVVAFNSTNNQFFVVWEGEEITFNEFEIYGQRLDAAGGAVGTNDFRISDVGGERNFEAFDSAVAYNSTDNEFLVVWSGDDTGSEVFNILANASARRPAPRWAPTTFALLI